MTPSWTRWPRGMPWPSINDRTEVAVTLTGWRSAHHFSGPGMVRAGTNALEANTSGASSGNAAACADSGLSAGGAA